MMPLVALLLMLPASVRAEPPSDPVAASSNPLFEEFVAAYQKWFDASRRATTPEEAGRFPRPDGAAYARKFLAIAREHPDDAAAATALSRAIAVDPFGASTKEALDGLIARHARSPGIDGVLYTISFDVTRPDVESFLRRVLLENPSPKVRASAALSLANHLRRIASEGEFLREHPDRAERVAREAGEAEVRRLRDRDEAALRREVDGFLELLSRDYAGLIHDEKRGITYGEQAEAVLREIHGLVVGEKAPEIAGVDAERRPLKLSDHRGKVVVLVWWASWCGPCMAMIPHERELARRYQGRPFAILGINGDEDEGRMRKAIAENGITWPTWVDGGPQGPISRFWNVKGWPTVYVLDADGIIRYKGGHDEAALDRAVEAALMQGTSRSPDPDGHDPR